MTAKSTGKWPDALSTEQGGEARAAHGTQLIERLPVDLSQRYKRGFSTRNPWQIPYILSLFSTDWKFRRHCLRNLQIHTAAKTFPLPGQRMSAFLSVNSGCPISLRERDAT